MYFTASLNGISLLIYWHYAWPVWPGPAPWQTDTPPRLLPSSDVSLGYAGPGSADWPQCPASGAGPRSPSSLPAVSAWASLSVVLTLARVTPPPLLTLVTIERHETQKAGSEWRKLETGSSFALIKKHLGTEGQFNKSVVCDKLDVPDCDWIDHISR